MTSYRHTAPRPFSFHTPNHSQSTKFTHIGPGKLGGQKSQTKKRAEELKQTAKEAGSKRMRCFAKTKPPAAPESEPAATNKRPAAKVKKAKGKSGSKNKGLLWRIRHPQDSRARICHYVWCRHGYVWCRHGCVLIVVFGVVYEVHQETDAELPVVPPCRLIRRYKDTGKADGSKVTSHLD